MVCGKGPYVQLVFFANPQQRALRVHQRGFELHVHKTEPSCDIFTAKASVAVLPSPSTALPTTTKAPSILSVYHEPREGHQGGLKREGWRGHCNASHSRRRTD